MSEAPGLRRFLLVYALAQLAATLTLPAVVVANLQSVSPDSPLGLRGMVGRIANAYGDSGYWIAMSIVSAGVLALQVLALAGVRTPVPHLSRPPRLLLSCLPAGLALVPLTAAAIFTLVAFAIAFKVEIPEPRLPRRATIYLPLMFLGVVLALWAVGTAVAWWLITRGARRCGSYERRMARLCRALLILIIVLAALLLPLEARARMRPAYEAQLTMQPLLILGLVGFTVTGPMLVFARLARARSGWYAAHCDRCGYDKGHPGELARCPECALEWTPAQQSAP